MVVPCPGFERPIGSCTDVPSGESRRDRPLVRGARLSRMRAMPYDPAASPVPFRAPLGPWSEAQGFQQAIAGSAGAGTRYESKKTEIFFARRGNELPRRQFPKRNFLPRPPHDFNSD